MTPGRGKTALGLAGWTVLMGLGLVWLLYVELAAAGRQDGSTISELFWIVWANQPWTVFIVSHVIGAPFWYLLGHFTAQSRKVYDEIRKGDA